MYLIFIDLLLLLIGFFFRWKGIFSQLCDPYCDDVGLVLASYLVSNRRENVYITLGYRSLIDFAHSKVTAKYVCGVNNPNQQTVVSSTHVAKLFQDANMYEIRNLGGKLGKIVYDDST